MATRDLDTVVDIANSGAGVGNLNKAEWAMVAANPGYTSASARAAQQSTQTQTQTQTTGSQFDYGAWRKGEDERLAREAETRRINQALQSMQGFFEANGLMSLWGGVDKYVRQGYNDFETILGILSRDSEYQNAYNNRFPAVKQIREINAQRAAQGLPPRPEPSAAAYVALEAGYRQALTGLPEGVWGTSQDIADWIVNDVSPQEVTDRVTTAKNYIYYNANSFVKTELKSIYGLTDEEMVSYVLDPERALEVIEREYDRRLSQANVAGGARSQGVGLSELLRDEIAETQFGSTFDMASQTFKGVASESKAYERLGSLAREETSQADLIREAFGISGAAEAGEKKQKLASQERARFSGQSALSRTSLATKRAR